MSTAGTKSLLRFRLQWELVPPTAPQQTVPKILSSNGSEESSAESGLCSAAAPSSFESEGGGPSLGIKKQKTATAAAKAKILNDGKTSSSLRLVSEAMDRFGDKRRRLEKQRLQLTEMKFLHRLMVDTGAGSEEITAERENLMKGIWRGLEADDGCDENVAAPVSTSNSVAVDVPQTKGSSGNCRFPQV